MTKVTFKLIKRNIAKKEPYILSQGFTSEQLLQPRPFASKQSNEPSACVFIEFITHVFYACSADITDEAGRGRGGEHPCI